MKYLILLWLLCGFCISAFAQTITIKHKNTNDPVELVTITSDNPRKIIATNAHGMADISEMSGSSVIEIRSLGFKTMVTSYSALQSLQFVVLLETSNLNLDEIVVSGTRWRQSSGNVPAKIISIPAREITLQNPQTAADLLNISGKVFIQKSQQGGGSPMIRGFATNRLLYTVDGVRMNNAIFRSGNIQNVINLDPFATERTEILFGPGSVIYGSDAIGGVMSFQTLTPQLSLEKDPLISGKAVVRYSSANKEKTGHFDINSGWKKWAMVTSFSSWDFDHLRQGNNGTSDYLKPYYVERRDSIDEVITQADPLLQIPTAYTQYNLMQKILFKPNAYWEFQYGFHFSETSSYGRYDRHARVRNGTARYGEWNYGPQIWMMNNLNITNSNNTILYDQLTLRLAIQKFKESRIDRSLNNTERNTQSEKVDAYSVNLDFTKTVLKKHRLYYGAEYVFNDITSTGYVTDISNGVRQAGPSRYPKSTWSSIAAYINEEFTWSSKVTLQAGLRYSRFMLDADFDTTFYPFPFTTAQINNGSLTGSFGGVYRPTDTWVLNANASTAFRSPNIDDLGKVFDSEPGAVTVPNPDLKAEYAYNFDLGIAKVFNDFIKVDVTAFYTILNNALVRRNFQLNGLDSIIYDNELSQVQAIQNAAVMTVYGLQAGLEIKFPEGFSFSADLNYQEGEEELDDKTKSPARHAAPLFGVARVNYNYNKLSMQLNLMAQAEKKFSDLPQEEQAKDEIYAKDDDGNNYAPSWYTLNLKITYAYSSTFTLSTGIENITDQRYRPYSSGISGAGRNFVLSVKASF